MNEYGIITVADNTMAEPAKIEVKGPILSACIAAAGGFSNYSEGEAPADELVNAGGALLSQEGHCKRFTEMIMHTLDADMRKLMMEEGYKLEQLEIRQVSKPDDAIGVRHYVIFDSASGKNLVNKSWELK